MLLLPNPVLAIVVPCFNEEEVIEQTASKLAGILNSLISVKSVSPSSFMLFIDDGSHDGTWAKLSELSNRVSHSKAIRLSRNYGHQNALLAGLEAVQDHADCVISIDADLQQDEKAIPQFLEKYMDGADVVLGVRENRDSDGLFKKYTALLFYKLMRTMGVNIVNNHADYRLLSNRALNALMQYEETNLFLRGLILDFGFRVAEVPFTVKERPAGESKYSLSKMLGFALDGITSFSVTPLRLVSALGFFIFLIAAVMSGYILSQALWGHVVPGWASTVLPIYLIGGIQIFCLGIVGEYIGKIYKEVKRRPRYIIDRRTP